MIDCIEDTITDDELFDIESGNYAAGALESAAVDAYFDAPIRERIRLHEQELVNLRAARREAEDTKNDAIEAMLEENRPPFENSPRLARNYSEIGRAHV